MTSMYKLNEWRNLFKFINCPVVLLARGQCFVMFFAQSKNIKAQAYITSREMHDSITGDFQKVSIDEPCFL